MKISRYFSALSRAYSDEIDDLLTDSDGKTVLQQRLAIKRREIDAILPMIAFSPEMVSVAFYDAFSFSSAAPMQEIAQSEPGTRGFLDWAVLSKTLSVAPWAVPLVEATLKADDGDAFLVATATLEFLRGHRHGAPETDTSQERSDDEESDDDEQDLAEAGADWLAEQGFETTRQ